MAYSIDPVSARRSRQCKYDAHYGSVPSRIYSWTDHRPLAGQRFGIKDIFDVKGLVTTSGSIAWTMITDPANATAPAIQRIVSPVLDPLF
jgi:Asp-tRNA(Asn)/Glu-tRNA(Gln) amidotransferase A subunit family amidase